MPRKLYRAADRLFVNDDCVVASKSHLVDNSVDLIVTDPPYGIQGEKLDQHYHRKEKFVVGGYIDVPAGEYEAFTNRWIAEAVRVLRPGGTIYVVSGRTHLRHVLNALEENGLTQQALIGWKYNFGVWTTKKPVTSHYTICMYSKPPSPPTYNLECRYGQDERDKTGNLNFRDREDDWHINRENKPGREKNKNELPSELLVRMIQYSSNPGDLVADFFLGGGSTARVALGLGRRIAGFELSSEIFGKRVSELMKIVPGSLPIRTPILKKVKNRGERWTDKEEDALVKKIVRLVKNGMTKEGAIKQMQQELGRGYWALVKAMQRSEARHPAHKQLKLL